MQVDFYYLTRDPAEKLVPTLASKCLDANARVLLVSASAEQRTSLSKALWTHTPASFLANDTRGRRSRYFSSDKCSGSKRNRVE